VYPLSAWQVEAEEVPKHRPFARASLVDGLAELEMAARLP
jgi:hypothetical protein